MFLSEFLFGYEFFTAIYPIFNNWAHSKPVKAFLSSFQCVSVENRPKDSGNQMNVSTIKIGTTTYCSYMNFSLSSKSFLINNFMQNIQKFHNVFEDPFICLFSGLSLICTHLFVVLISFELKQLFRIIFFRINFHSVVRHNMPKKSTWR